MDTPTPTAERDERCRTCLFWVRPGKGKQSRSGICGCRASERYYQMTPGGQSCDHYTADPRKQA